MQRGGDVNFTYEWERALLALEEGDEEYEYVMLAVSAKVGDFYPEVRNLRNGDPGYPAEGGEVEDVEAIMPDGSVLDPIPSELYELLVVAAAEQDQE